MHTKKERHNIWLVLKPKNQQKPHQKPKHTLHHKNAQTKQQSPAHRSSVCRGKGSALASRRRRRSSHNRGSMRYLSSSISLKMSTATSKASADRHTPNVCTNEHTATGMETISYIGVHIRACGLAAAHGGEHRAGLGHIPTEHCLVDLFHVRDAHSERVRRGDTPTCRHSRWVRLWPWCWTAGSAKSGRSAASSAATTVCTSPGSILHYTQTQNQRQQ